MNMKTWKNPELEELKVELTAAKGNKKFCEIHKHGNGHGGPCTPDCSGWDAYDESEGETMS